MRSRAALFGLLGVFLVAAGCARAVPKEAPVPVPGTARVDTVMVPDTSTVLEVENNTTLDIRIFVLRGSMPFRLGTVLGKTTSQFPLSTGEIEHEIRFYASPVGSSARQTTDPMLVHQGQTVSWRLDDQLRSFRIMVY